MGRNGVGKSTRAGSYSEDVGAEGMGTAGRSSKHLVQFPKIPVGERTCCDTKMILKKSKNQMNLQSALHAGMEVHLCRRERFSPNRFNPKSKCQYPL
jgi:hypothetical protein